MVVFICDGCVDSGSFCDDGDFCMIDDVFDWDCNCGGWVIDEDGDQIFDFCDLYVGVVVDFFFEIGIVLFVMENWQMIILIEIYDFMVVIVILYLIYKIDLLVVICI